MLLGSPPDMVRGHPLRETGSAAAYGGMVRIYFTILFSNSQYKNEKFPKKSLYKQTKCGIISFVVKGSFPCGTTEYGLVAQLGERCVRIAEVEGSIPFESTILRKITAKLAVIFHLTTTIPHTELSFDYFTRTRAASL